MSRAVTPLYGEHYTEVSRRMHTVTKFAAVTVLMAAALLAWCAPQSPAAGSRFNIATFGSDGTSATSFGEPDQIAIDQSKDVLYVLERSPPSIHAFDLPGLTPTGGAFPLSVPFLGPYANLSVDNTAGASAGHIVYLSTGGGSYTINGYDSSGAPLGGNFPVSVPGEITGSGVDNVGNIWAGDWANKTNKKFSATGVKDEAGNIAIPDSQGNGRPANSAFDSNGDMYLAMYSGSVWKYSAASGYAPGAAKEVTSVYTSGLTIDPIAHRLFLVQTKKVSVYDTETGNLLYSFATDIENSSLKGVAVDQDTDTAYVSDRENNKVYAFGPLKHVPSVSTGSLPKDHGDSVTVGGTVNTDSVLTDCHFEYVSVKAFEESKFSDLSSGGTVPCEPDGASVPTDSVDHRVSAEINQSEAIFFRLVAATSDGSAAGRGQVSKFRVVGFDGAVVEADGSPATQAGGHPFQAYTEFQPPFIQESDGEFNPERDLKDVVVDFPPGLVGYPDAVGTCRSAQLAVLEGACPPDSMVGIMKLGYSEGIAAPWYAYYPVSSMERLPGHAATFGVNVAGAVVLIQFSVRTGTDYGLRAEVVNQPQTLPIVDTKLTFWGVPADDAFDSLRGPCLNPFYGTPWLKSGCPLPSNLTPKPFLTLPTSCLGPQRTDLTLKSWAGVEAKASFLSHDNTSPLPVPIGTEGCNTLDFSPSLEARPTTNVADSPTGLNVDIHVPQNTEPTGTTSAHLRNAHLTLPEGMVLNPAGANGLSSCSAAQIGLTSEVGSEPITFTPDAAECPSTAKLGTVQIDTPTLNHPIFGGLYLAVPHENPFGSLVALYLAVHDPVSGVVIKLPGEVALDPATGRVRVAFDENPQLPFEDLTIKVFGGTAGPLRTPANCGTYATASELTPWSAPYSGPPSKPSDVYAIQRGAVGGTCPSSAGERGHTPTFDAGTETPLAGTDSPLVVNLRRDDGTQEFSSVTISPPPGLIGKLAGIPYCPDPALSAAKTSSGAQEQASPSCPAGSEVGHVYAAVGAGPSPYNVPGKAYLTGPYKGAPLSLAIVTPAVAGPFDLGTIVVRVALRIDPTTARITAISDQIPSMLEGIPLDLRTVSIQLDRPSFTRNPTSCDPMSFDGELFSVLGRSAPLFSRFQLGECGRLGFEPKMTLKLSGGTGRRAHPSLTAVLTTKPRDANLKSVSVAMPPTELLDQSHIRTVCTRVQFAADSCPSGSIYGYATVTTPILGQNLTGPVYLRSSSNKLPDLVTDLRGPADQPIRLEAAGKTDTAKGGGLRNTFSSIPDAPFSRLVLELKGGRTGLLQNSTDVCRKKLRATVKFGAQNGLRSVTHPALQAACGKKKRKKPNRTDQARAGKRSAR